MQRWKKTLIVMVAACGLVGCGAEPSAPDRNTVSIQKDGTIAHTIVDGFEPELYDAEELSAMAQEKIGRYDDGPENITCDSVEAEDGKIIVKMTYQTESAYSDFNNRELFNGTVSEASTRGYSLKDVVGEDGKGISDTELDAIGERHIVIIQTGKGEELDVRVYDKILYTSGNVTLSGNQNAVIAASEEDKLSCIIFQ